MAYSLTKQERKILGESFAKLLIRRAEARPEELPDLINRKDWKESTGYERQKKCSEIVERGTGNLDEKRLS